MKACAECDHRTRANLCGMAQELGFGAVWCQDQIQPIRTDTIDAHLAAINHPLMRCDNVAIEQHLRGIAASEGRCVALAVWAKRKEEMRKEIKQ